ncbi:MAG: DeoR family transcriptional regulator [Bacteroidetes bacterium]|nr:DeoR family transcriptional regulator [Bacteroidota bacterium]
MNFVANFSGCRFILNINAEIIGVANILLSLLFQLFMKAVSFVKEKGKISNADFQELYGVSKATATRDLTELVEKYELFEKLGQTGAGTAYILKK